MVSTLWNRLWSLKGGCSTTKPRKKLLVEFGGGFQLRIMASSVKDVYRQIAKWSAEPFPSGVGYREIVTAERNKDWHGHTAVSAAKEKVRLASNCWATSGTFTTTPFQRGLAS